MDRRFIWAMALMTLIVMAPAVLMKKPPAPVSAPADSVATVAPVPAPAPDLGAAAALARKKAFDGTVHYEFSHENKFAHVSWKR